MEYEYHYISVNIEVKTSNIHYDSTALISDRIKTVYDLFKNNHDINDYAADSVSRGFRSIDVIQHEITFLYLGSTMRKVCIITDVTALHVNHPGDEAAHLQEQHRLFRAWERR